MTGGTDSRERPPARPDGDEPPDHEPAAFLWSIASLIAVLELTWLLFGRMYAG